MKRFVSSLAVLACAAAPLTALGASLSAGQMYSLPAQKTVNGNLYVASGTTTIGGRVTGDLFAAGGTISVSGAVAGDVAAAGGTIQVLAPVQGDVRALGGTVTVNDRVGGDLVVLGGTAHVLPGAVIEGDMIVAGGQVIIEGAISGSLKQVGGTLSIQGVIDGDVDAKVKEQLVVGPDAVIGGALTYQSEKDAVIDEGARIVGKVTYNPRSVLPRVPGRGVPQKAAWAVLGVFSGMQLLAVLGLTAALMWRWRRGALDVLSSVHTSFAHSLGRGLAYLVLVPMAGVLLLISFVGTLPGVLLMMAFGAGLILTKALAGMFFGALLVTATKKKPTLQLTWWSALGGVIGLKLIGLIPVVGWLASFAIWLAVFGALAHRFQESAWNS